MTDTPITPKTLEQLETEIVSLKIRLKRVESFKISIKVGY
jgi:hypothetical protein